MVVVVSVVTTYHLDIHGDPSNPIVCQQVIDKILSSTPRELIALPQSKAATEKIDPQSIIILKDGEVAAEVVGELTRNASGLFQYGGKVFTREAVGEACSSWTELAKVIGEALAEKMRGEGVELDAMMGDPIDWLEKQARIVK